MVRALLTGASRRGLLRRLSALPLAGGLAAFLLDDDESDARQRKRKKRKKRQKRQKRSKRKQGRCRELNDPCTVDGH